MALTFPPASFRIAVKDSRPIYYAFQVFLTDTQIGTNVPLTF